MKLLSPRRPTARPSAPRADSAPRAHSAHTAHNAPHLLAGVVVIVVVALTATACGTATAPTPKPTAKPAPAGAYVPATDRNADFLGESPLTSAQVHDIAANDARFTLAKFADKYDVDDQFADAKALMTAADAAGNPGLRVDMYYNASFWLTANSAWKQYAAGFDPAWLLTDANGATIPYVGQSHGASQDHAAGGTVLGHVVNLADPAYRAWAVQTVVAWMHQAPLGGITLDSADLLVGTTVRADVGTGTQTWNDLLCGTDAPVDANGDCAAVTAWNAGLHDLLAQMTQALTPLGDQVTFNGVAPSVLRTSDRNQELFADAPVADNEGFCMAQATPDKKSNSATVAFTSVADDVAMMRTQAAAGHGIMEITNYEDDAREAYGPYCVGAFLMGWQPGSDFLAFHRNYSDPLGSAYPELPEANLALGLPTAQETDSGGVMTRDFTHGVVTVNTTGSSQTVTLPDTVTQFAGGHPEAEHAAGSTVTLAAHSADFFLGDTFLATLAT